MLGKLKRFMSKKLNNHLGITMVELLVVIAIIGVALAPASTALVTGLNMFAVETDNMERIYDAQSALDYITDVVRVNGDKRLSITKYPEDGTLDGNALKIDDVIVYYDDTDSTIKKIEKGISGLLLENVAALRFDNIKSTEDVVNRFDVAIELIQRDYGNETFETTIYLRNQ